MQPIVLELNNQQVFLALLNQRFPDFLGWVKPSKQLSHYLEDSVVKTLFLAMRSLIKQHNLAVLQLRVFSDKVRQLQLRQPQDFSVNINQIPSNNFSPTMLLTFLVKLSLNNLNFSVSNQRNNLLPFSAELLLRLNLKPLFLVQLTLTQIPHPPCSGHSHLHPPLNQQEAAPPFFQIQ